VVAGATESLLVEMGAVKERFGLLEDAAKLLKMLMRYHLG
jgi:hypothetical protein